MGFQSIRYKLFFLIFSTIILLAAALLAVMGNVVKNVTEEHYYEFSRQEFVQIDSYIKRLVSQVEQSSSIIANDSDVKLSVNLIDKYQQRFDYKNETFNAQKQKLAAILERYANVSASANLALFDSKKQLISFFGQNGGYVRYKDTKALITDLDGNSVTPAFTTDIEGRSTGSVFFTAGQNLHLNYLKKIRNNGSHVGYILSTLPLDARVFNTIKDKNFCLMLQTPQGSFISRPSCKIEGLQNGPQNSGDATVTLVENPENFIYRYNASLQDLQLYYITSKQRYEENIGSLQKQLFVIVLLITLAAGLITYLFTKRFFLTPFKRFYEGFRQLQSGNYEHEIKVGSKDEIKHLADAFNAMSRRIHKSDAEKTKNYEEVILALVDIIEQRDTYTAGHSRRVAKYCKLIAQNMGLEPHTVTKLYKAAMLHDIGKIQTPDSILLKPDRLSKLEYTLIKEHVSISDEILEKLTMYKDLARIVKYHHERYDGNGYPFGIKGDEIPLLSRIMIVADAFDAMTTNRIYKPRMSLDQAIEELRKNSGSQFDPSIVDHAVVALQDVTLPDTGDQLPHSAVERERFAYFFKDNLTHAYNTDYFNTVLNKDEFKDKLAYIVQMRNFSRYNNTYGWNAGDKFLITFVHFIKQHYPHAMIFRVQGDDFIIICDKLDTDFVKAFADEIITLEISSISLRGKDSLQEVLQRLKQ